MTWWKREAVVDITKLAREAIFARLVLLFSNPLFLLQKLGEHPVTVTCPTGGHQVNIDLIYWLCFDTECLNGPQSLVYNVRKDQSTYMLTKPSVQLTLGMIILCKAQRAPCVLLKAWCLLQNAWVLWGSFVSLNLMVLFENQMAEPPMQLVLCTRLSCEKREKESGESCCTVCYLVFTYSKAHDASESVRVNEATSSSICYALVYKLWTMKNMTDVFKHSH